LGRPVAELHPRFEGLLAETMREQTSLSAREEAIEIGGRQFPCECETSLLRDAKGAVSGAALVFQDLTERKQFEEEVRRVDRLASVGTLAAGLAHEIKNPLVAIQTFTQLLPERFDETAFRDRFTTVVGNEVSRINNLVHNMLDLARPRNEIPSEVQLHDVLDQVVALLHNQLVKHNITLHQHRSAHIPPVCCSMQQMHQVFLNLLQNALEAMTEQDGGELTVSTAFENGRKRDNSTNCESCVRVVVQDTGCGMSKEQLQRIFDPFYSTKANGSGLGLSNCLSILKEQGATVSVDSTPGVGSVFTILIPLTPPSPSEAANDDNHPNS
ncbi:MAG: two-component system sensor histidine kinase NtrB, partial [bacterium]